MPIDSPFLAPFNDYLIRIQQFGLTSKWEKYGVATGKLSGELEIMHEEDYGIFRPLCLSDLQFAWLCLVIGNGLGALLFLGLWFNHFVLGCLGVYLIETSISPKNI